MFSPATLRLSRAPLAVFAAMGVLWGTFAADLPDIKTMLEISETRLGMMLFMTPIAAMAAMLAAPAIGQRLGRIALPVTALAMATAFALPGQMSHWTLFAVAMLGCGAGTGAADVLMNARVSALEGRHGTPLMNLCHAGYSFGYAAGAIGTGALRSQGLPPSVVMPLMSLFAATLILLSFEPDGQVEGLTRPKGETASGLGLVPVIGGGIILIAFLTENAAESWSALHIEQTLHGSPALGAAGPAVLALTMGVARTFGQGIAQRIDAIKLLLGGALVAASGALIVASAGTAAVAYAGFIIMGTGSSVIGPTAFTLVGALSDPAQRARAIARATLLGYFGYFIGPPAVGFVAGSFGMPAAFVFTAAMLMTIWALAPMMSRHR